jgi:hypothetical protein
VPTFAEIQLNNRCNNIKPAAQCSIGYQRGELQSFSRKPSVNWQARGRHKYAYITGTISQPISVVARLQGQPSWLSDAASLAAYNYRVSWVWPFYSERRIMQCRPKAVTKVALVWVSRKSLPWPSMLSLSDLAQWSRLGAYTSLWSRLHRPSWC